MSNNSPHNATFAKCGDRKVPIVQKLWPFLINAHYFLLVEYEIFNCPSLAAVVLGSQWITDYTPQADDLW